MKNRYPSIDPEVGWWSDNFEKLNLPLGTPTSTPIRGYDLPSINKPRMDRPPHHHSKRSEIYTISRSRGY